MGTKREPISKRIKNRRHRLFIDKYFELGLNATQAYMAVYQCDWPTANANGPKLLVNTSVKEEIDYRLEQYALSSAQVLGRLSLQAQSDIGDFASIDSTKDLEDHPLSAVVHKFKKRTWTDKAGDKHEEVELELYNSQSALVHLGKAHSLFTDKIEHSSDPKKPMVVKVIGGVSMKDLLPKDA